MRTVVALFDKIEDAQRAVMALTDHGFIRDNINMIASDADSTYAQNLDAMKHEDVSGGAATGAGIGAVIGGLSGLLVGLGALMIPGIGPVLAAGPIVSALAGAGVGAVAGGLVGALVDMGIPEEHAQYYAEGIRRGGTLVSVRSEDERAEEARDLLNRFSPVDIQNRAGTWRNQGWTGFNENREFVTDRDVDESNMARDVDTTGGIGVTGMPYDRGVEHRSTDMEEVDDEPEITADDEDVSRMDSHLREDVYGKERAGQNVDIPVTGGDVADVEDRRIESADWDMYDQEFRNDYQTRFGSGAYSYDYYMPAYHFGYDLAHEDRYRGYTWDMLEKDARYGWEMRGMRGAWEDVKDAVRHAWEAVTR